MATGVVPFPPRCLPSIFIAHRIQQSHCSSIFHRMLLTDALALFASQLVHKKKSQRIYTSKHSAGLELTKLTYTRLEDNLIRHRGDRAKFGGVWSGSVRFALCYMAGSVKRSTCVYSLTGSCLQMVRVVEEETPPVRTFFDPTYPPPPHITPPHEHNLVYYFTPI